MRHVFLAALLLASDRAWSDELAASIESHTDAIGAGEYSHIVEALQSLNDDIDRRRGEPAGTHYEPGKSFDDGTELFANKAVAARLFENDVVLTKAQLDDILGENGRRSKRKVIAGYSNRWPSKRIPYRFLDRSVAWQANIRAALRYWEERTCIRFIEDGAGPDFVTFIRGTGCYSSVGRTGGSQQISVGEGCSANGIIVHEIGHMLGFWHEQSRPDRDAHIRIKLDNVMASTRANFNKRVVGGVDYYDTPYDHGSIMHYGPSAFAKTDKLITIEPTDRNFQTTMGQRAALSFVDRKQINKAYCSGECGGAQLSCQHGGYADSNDCSRCVCADGLGGRECDAVAPSIGGSCGGESAASTQWRTIRASASGRELHCFWRLRAPAGHRVRVEFTALRLPCAPTCKSYVELKHYGDLQPTGNRFCCGIPTTAFVTDLPEAVLIFHSAVGDPREYRFELKFKLDGAPQPPPPPVALGSTWLPWGSWTACSVTCGGCGLRTRRRFCSTRHCNRRESQQRVACGQQPCPELAAAIEACERALGISCAFLRYRLSDDDQLAAGLPSGVSSDHVASVGGVCQSAAAVAADDDEGTAPYIARGRGRACCTGYLPAGPICQKTIGRRQKPWRLFPKRRRHDVEYDLPEPEPEFYDELPADRQL